MKKSMTGRKWIAVFLSLALIFTLLPVTAISAKAAEGDGFIAYPATSGPESNTEMLYVDEGEAANLQVEVSGAVGNVTYVWEHQEDSDEMVVLEGENTNTLSVYSDGKEYYLCTVTDESGNTAYVYFFVFLYKEKTYTVAAKDNKTEFAVSPGDDLDLEIEVTSEPDDELDIFWMALVYEDEYENSFSQVDDEIDTILHLENIQESTKYQAVVQDQHGNSETIEFRIIVMEGDFLVTQSEPYVTVYPDESATMEVNVYTNSDEQISYEWSYMSEWDEDYQVIAEETQPSITVSPDLGYYYFKCVVTQGDYSEEKEFHVNVTSGLYGYGENNGFIMTNVGENVSLVVNAETNDPSGISYEWYRGRTPDGELVEGVTGTSYEVTLEDQVEYYYCAISDSYETYYVSFTVYDPDDIPVTASATGALPIDLDEDVYVYVPSGGSAWYVFEAPADAEYELIVEGKGTPELSVYEGSADNVIFSDYNTYWYTGMTEGETYYIQLTPNEEDGDCIFSLRIQQSGYIPDDPGEGDAYFGENTPATIEEYVSRLGAYSLVAGGYNQEYITDGVSVELATLMTRYYYDWQGESISFGKYYNELERLFDLYYDELPSEEEVKAYLLDGNTMACTQYLPETNMIRFLPLGGGGDSVTLVPYQVLHTEGEMYDDIWRVHALWVDYMQEWTGTDGVEGVDYYHNDADGKNYVVLEPVDIRVQMLGMVTASNPLFTLGKYEKGSSYEEISEDDFPDENLRNAIAQEYGCENADGILLYAPSFVNELNLNGKNEITDLTGLETLPGLKALYVNGLGLTELDTSAYPVLNTLHCNNNQLTSLKVPASISWLECENNQLTSFGIPADSNLDILHCSGNLITTLDVSEYKELSFLFCDDYVVLTGDIPEGLMDQRTETNDIAKAVVSGISAKTYTGKALTQSPKLVRGNLYTYDNGWKLKDNVLKSGTDYKISYTDNTKAGTATMTITGLGRFEGTSLTKTFKINKAAMSSTKISGIAAKTYTGKALTQKPVVKLGSVTLKSGTDYTLSYKNNTKAGTATVTITGKGNLTGSVSKTFKINKATNPLTAKGKTKTLYYSKLKSQAQTITVKNAFSVSKAQGKVTYKKTSGNAKITVSSAGKITVKKGLAKGKYPVKVKVTAAGNSNYKSITKTVTVTVVVK